MNIKLCIMEKKVKKLFVYPSVKNVMALTPTCTKRKMCLSGMGVKGPVMKWLVHIHLNLRHRHILMNITQIKYSSMLK